LSTCGAQPFAPVCFGPQVVAATVSPSPCEGSEPQGEGKLLEEFEVAAVVEDSLEPKAKLAGVEDADLADGLFRLERAAGGEPKNPSCFGAIVVAATVSPSLCGGSEPMGEGKLLEEFKDAAIFEDSLKPKAERAGVEDADEAKALLGIESAADGEPDPPKLPKPPTGVLGNGEGLGGVRGN